MSAAAGTAFLLLVGVAGFAAWRVLRRFEPVPAALAVPVLGVVVVGLWLVALALAAVHWSAVLLVLPLAAAAVAAVAWNRPRRRPQLPRDASQWLLLATVTASGTVITATTASGWDFRYIWGLKAKVYAAAGGFDPRWLAWPPNRLTHSHYPPLWSTAIAAGPMLGLPVPVAASLLTAVCAAALALACWSIARPAGRQAALAAGAAAAFAPVMFQPRYIGNAEAPLAAVFAVGLAALAGLEDRSASAPRELSTPDLPVLLGVSVAVLPLIKVEGLALAAALVAGVASLGRLRRAALYGLLAAAPAGTWMVYLAVHGIAGEPRALAPRHLLDAAATAGRWLIRTGGGPALTVGLVWLLLTPRLLRRLRGSTVALAVWGLAVAFAYLTTVQPLEWQLGASLDRVAAVALPGALAVALRRSGRRHHHEEPS